MNRRRGAAAVFLIPAMTAVLAVTACGGPTATPTPTTAGTAADGRSTASAGAPADQAPVKQPEVNPAGDIPDDQVFVPYTPPGAHFGVTVPEGWARSTTKDGVTFTDKLNSITVTELPATAAASTSSVTASVVPALARQVPGFAAGKVSAVQRKGGTAVLVTYLGNSAPDPVTNKLVRDAFERYAFWKDGREAVLTLSGPKGADNVDPWKIVSDSLRWL